MEFNFNIKNFGKFSSLIQVANFFSNEDVCYNFLEKQRWGSTVVCPYCGCVHNHKTTENHRFKCSSCNHKFSVLVDTIFQNTKLSLQKWFMAIYLIATHKKGIASTQLAVDLDITQKTAWFILHKVRSLMVQDENITLYDTQCDEMYMGGREKNKHLSNRTEGTQGRSYKTKTPVFGMVDKFGNAVAKVVTDTKSATIIPLIQKYVRQNSKVWTDEFSIYQKLSNCGYIHEFVQHKENQFVLTNGVNTNAIEGLWGQLKRMVWGIYHNVSKKHLQHYLDEAVFRHNTLDMQVCDKFALLFSKAVGVCAEMVELRRQIG